MATPSTMILSSLRMIGDKAPGGTLTTAEQTDYLYDLNAAMESWGLDRSMCYQLLQESKALTTSTGSYTIGSGAAFDTARPNKIVDPCFIRDASNLDYPLTIIDAQAYGRITQKTLDGSTPQYLFYDHAYTTAFGTIFLYPEPSASLTLYINSWKQLTTFATIGETVSLPPGYQLAIESNFAVMKAGGFTKASPELVKTARDSMARIQSLNLKVGTMSMPAGLVSGRRSNILTNA